MRDYLERQIASVSKNPKRANFQSVVWKKALDVRQNLPKPKTMAEASQMVFYNQF